MYDLERAARVLELAVRLRDAGSWCGETHLQKATYLIQGLAGADMGYPFVLYKYGPYSFDLHDDIAAMKADRLIDSIPRRPFGPTLVTTDAGKRLLDRLALSLEQVAPAMKFVIERVGGKDVFILEQLATGLYVRLQSNAPSEERARRLRELKPHIDPEDASRATTAIDALVAEAEQAKLRGVAIA